MNFCKKSIYLYCGVIESLDIGGAVEKAFHYIFGYLEATQTISNENSSELTCTCSIALETIFSTIKILLSSSNLSLLQPSLTLNLS
jgi:hypothetical protein